MQNIIANWVREWSKLSPTRQLKTGLIASCIVLCFALVFIYKDNDKTKEDRIKYLEFKVKEGLEENEKLQFKNDILQDKFERQGEDFRNFIIDNKNFNKNMIDSVKK